jgi:hypothetical protein
MAGTVTALAGGERTLGAAVGAFLTQPRPATTARTYTRTPERLAGELGRDQPLYGIMDGELADPPARCGAAWRRGPGTGTWPPPARSWPGAAGTAGPPGTWPCGPTAAPRPRTTPGRFRCPSWNACGHDRISRRGSGRCAAAV